VTGTGGCTTTASATVNAGTQPQQPTLACYQTATFNSTTCQWDVTGTQPQQPTLACYQSATFNNTTCQWDVTGTQPTAPTNLSCWQTATFNNTTCSWDVSGTQPSAPTGLACYETATFNNQTCSWVVSGTQPSAPTGLACWQTATFNNTTCSWDVSGTQPSAPTGLACYQTATFNTSTCQWNISGTPAPAIVTTASSCASYTWSENGVTYTTSGTYTYSANCQDYQLNLTIIPNNDITTTATACGSYTWSENGVTYTQSGTYTVPVTGPTVNAGGGMRISQVYGGGGGSTGTYLRDYVELYNSSCSPINIDGWCIAYGSATGTYGSSTGNIFTFPAGTTVGAKKYLLIEVGASGTSGTALPVTADFATPTTGFSMSGTQGKVGLFNTLITNVACTSLVASTVVDKFSWGSANCAEGIAKTAPTTAQVMVRNNGGETDTDNNNSDFTNTATSSAPPRNSASTANSSNPCTIP
ncbi:MAG: lamin tail domain-containing protein, partial [Bacteroidota bacterium]